MHLETSFIRTKKEERNPKPLISKAETSIRMKFLSWITMWKLSISLAFFVHTEDTMQLYWRCWFLSKNAVGSAQLLSSNKLRFRNTFGNCLLRVYSYLLDLFITRELLCGYSLNNGLYCTEWARSHLLFWQPLHGLKSSIMGCVPIFHNCVDWKVHSVVHA